MVVDAPLSKIINVTLLSTPVGIPEFNVNTIGLFTNETPGESFGSTGYKIYYSPDGVAEDFGTESETYDEAVAIFAQAPNVLSGSGYLVVIPLEEHAEATAGVMTTLVPGDISAFAEVSDGAFGITIDGSAEDIAGLDFTAPVTTYDGIATVIQTALNVAVPGTTCVYSATANNNTGGFVITSPTTGVNSKISALTSPTGEVTDVSGATYINGSGNVKIVNGKAATDNEDLVEAIERTKNMVFYFGVISPVAIALADAKNLATFIQTQDKMLFLGRYDSGEITTLFEWVKEASLSHTRCLYYSLGAADARSAAAAYASRLLSVQFSGSNTCATMNLKALAGISPDDYNSNIDYQAGLYGFDTYVSIAGDPCILSNGANGGYSDQIYNQLWIKLALQVAGYNYLKTTNEKIPQTEPGMDGLKGAYATVCRTAVNNGYAAPGLLWTSPTTFGNPEDLRRNIKEVGYYIYSLPIALQSPTDRTARKSPLIQIAIKEAGAIHSSDVIVQVN